MQAIVNQTGIAISIKVHGSFEVTSQAPAWQFGEGRLAG
jgi:hypothetical protein